MSSRWQEEFQIFKQDCENAIAISKENLRKLMDDNVDTEYGRKYDFRHIQNVQDYQENVPLSTYSDYSDAVDAMRCGKKNVLTVYDVKHYIMTSGSMGKQKYIPLSTEALRCCMNPIYFASYASIEGIEEGQYLHMSVFRMEPPHEEKDTILSAAFYRELYDSKIYDLDQRYLGGEKLLFTKGIGSVPYVKCWIALSSPQMAGIQAFFLYDIILFLHYMEEHYEIILQHMEQRSIPKEIPISEEVKALLLNMPMPDAEWINFVRKECEKGMRGIVKRLWPKLKFVSGVGGSTFFAQESVLRYYLNDIPIHYFSYAASECMMAIVTEPESVANVLMPRSGFFEFIPYGEENKVKTIEEVEIGKQYEIVITNFSGLYRYKSEDVVKIVGFYGEAPILEVCFRKNQAINVAGEKMDLQTIANAMQEMGRQFGLQIYEYSVCDEKNLLPGRYQCFIEADGDLTHNEEMNLVFDALLKKKHVDYADVRSLGLIAMPQICCVKKGTHAECKRHFGAKQAQNKPLQYLSDPEVIHFMKEKIL